MWIQVSPAEQVKSKDTCPAWGILISGSFLHFFPHFGLQRQWPQEDDFILVFKFAYMNIFLTPALPCGWAPQPLHKWKECLYEGINEKSRDSRTKIEHQNDQFKWFNFFFFMSNKVQPKLDIKPDLQVCKHSLAGGETLLNSCWAQTVWVWTYNEVSGCFLNFNHVCGCYSLWEGLLFCGSLAALGGALVLTELYNHRIIEVGRDN